jgi:hypothetical protein
MEGLIYKKKKKKNIQYFTQETEDFIVLYNNTDDYVLKSKIYGEMRSIYFCKKNSKNRLNKVVHVGNRPFFWNFFFFKKSIEKGPCLTSSKNRPRRDSNPAPECSSPEVQSGNHYAI